MDWILIVTLGTFAANDVPRAEAMFASQAGCVLGAQVYLREQRDMPATARCWNYVTNASVELRARGD